MIERHTHRGTEAEREGSTDRQIMTERHTETHKQKDTGTHRGQQ